MCKNEIHDYDEKVCSQFSDTVSHKIDFKTYGLFRDYPPAWGLKIAL